MSPHPLLVGAVQELARDAGADRAARRGVVAAKRARARDDPGLARTAVRQRACDRMVDAVSGRPRPISTPGYRWMRDRFWYDAPDAARRRRASVDRHGPGRADRVGRPRRAPSSGTSSCRSSTGPSFAIIRCAAPPCLPAAAYIVFARTCAAQVLRSASIRLEGLTIDSPLALSDSAPAHLQIVGRLGGRRVRRPRDP